MADMTSMVVAPAVFIFVVYSSKVTESIYSTLILFVAVSLFLFFGIVRLASFNVMKEKKTYVGLPASASAVILIILSYLAIHYLIILFTIVIMGALMASEFVFPKTDRKMSVIAVILILLTIIFGKAYYEFAPLLLLIAVFVYTFGGAFYMKLSKKQ
jgi:phosphatidylserine synthase